MAFYGIVLTAILICCLELIALIAQNYALQNSLSNSYTMLSGDIRLAYLGEIVSSSKFIHNTAELNEVNLTCAENSCVIKTVIGYYALN